MKILVVDDQLAAAKALVTFLARRGHEPSIASNGRAAWDLVQHQGFDLVLADVRMPEMDGLELTRRIVAEYPHVLVVLITAFASVPNAVEALRLGAFDYLTKPVDPDELGCVIERIAELVELRRELAILRTQVEGPQPVGGLVGRDPAMLGVYRDIRTAAKSDLRVLISGETGTGKTLAARAIHELGARSGGPMLELNCAAIPPGLFESELFGHVRGAFTGAVRTRAGKLKAAHKGTLLLDEIGCLDEAGQAKLLQVIEHPHVVPVGSDRGTDVDVRMIFASNDDLAERAESGTFRRDLYFRINVLPIHVPALRDRRGDLPMLVRYLLEQLAPERTLAVSPALMQLLLRQRWLGNVRELRNLLSVVVASCEGAELLVRHVPPSMRAQAVGDEGWQHQPLAQLIDDYERFLLTEALHRTGGQLATTAETLGISPRTLERKLARHGLSWRDFRHP